METAAPGLYTVRTVDGLARLWPDGRAQILYS